MREAERIADLHRRAFDGGSWHGPHVFEILEGVDAVRAARRPIAGAHSVWEIVLHMRAWEDVVLRRLRGEPVEPTDAEDWPPVSDASAKAWNAALTALRETHDELNREIASIADARLETTAPGGRTTLYRLAHGAVHHALYHAGQIALLKKG
jgi:uncharacterized damage-inducible protein DinB